jgi:hypothetical protein
MIGGSHLTPDTIIDVAEGRGSPQVVRHATECARCREQVAEVRAALALTAAADVPEPSPLFWDHLAERIGEALATEPAPAQAGWLDGLRLWASVAAATAVVILAVAVANRWDTPAGQATGGDEAVATAGVGGSAPGDVELASDPDDGTWALVTALSEELAGDELEFASLEPAAGTAERVLDELTLDEQGELVRLLEAELARRPL